MNPLHPAIAARAEYRCEYCHAPESAFNFAFEVEHIHPRSQGGDSLSENLALSCDSCNGFKSNAVSGREESSAELLPFFHPRRDTWELHFIFDVETSQIVGLTAVGRVTIARLRINSPFQIRARQHWIRLGLYP